MTHQQAVDKQAVERYLLDEMPEIERFAFEEHLFDCDICADDVRTGALMREGVEAGFLPAAATAVVATAAAGLDAFASKAAVTGETSQHADLTARTGAGWRECAALGGGSGTGHRRRLSEPVGGSGASRARRRSRRSSHP